jgi:hypothetical protein
MSTGYHSTKNKRHGKNPKSPKAKHRMKREAEANDIKAKPSRCHASNMKELLNK